MEGFFFLQAKKGSSTGTLSGLVAVGYCNNYLFAFTLRKEGDRPHRFPYCTAITQYHFQNLRFLAPINSFFLQLKLAIYQKMTDMLHGQNLHRNLPHLQPSRVAAVHTSQLTLMPASVPSCIQEHTCPQNTHISFVASTWLLSIDTPQVNLHRCTHQNHPKSLKTRLSIPHPNPQILIEEAWREA